jgi:hypothetical protein
VHRYRLFAILTFTIVINLDRCIEACRSGRRKEARSCSHKEVRSLKFGYVTVHSLRYKFRYARASVEEDDVFIVDSDDEDQKPTQR